MSQAFTLAARPTGSSPATAYAVVGDSPRRVSWWKVSAAVATGLALASQPVQAQPADSLEVVDEFTFIGQGESRATNTILPEDLQTNLPGVSVEKAIDDLPGVNVTARDPWGFYESGNDIRIRSFDISKLAVSIDDVPLGTNDSRFGTPAGRLLDGENLSQIKVSQGVGDVSSPAYEALGGSISYYTRDPDTKPGALLRYSFGDFDARRAFGRFDTGEFLKGWTAYFSASELRLKTAGVPADSERRNLEGKVLYTFDKGSVSFTVTYNERDDFDTNTIRWDRWRALETGDAYAGYPRDIYSAAQRTILETYAANGYVEYTPQDFPQLNVSSDSIFQGLGDLRDEGRLFGPSTYIDPTTNPGDLVNSRYYRLWRNGREDIFVRSRFKYDFNESLSMLATPYFQNKHYYGLFPVSRADSRSQIQNAYRDAEAAGKIRDDIWPVWAFRDASGNLVPNGTPGATPVGFNDTNGFFDRGETLNTTTTVTAFSNNHALISPRSTSIATATPGIPGATGREEIFTGYRAGAFTKFTLKVEDFAGNHVFNAGFWIEKDYQEAYRPTYNLENGDINGDFIRDQVLFSNYDRELETDVWSIFISDDWNWWQPLTISLGAKAMAATRSAEGQLDPSYFQEFGEDRFIEREVDYDDYFQPQLGFVYELTPALQLFGNYAETFAVPNNAIISSRTYSEALDPETAKNYDLGVRYAKGPLAVGFSVYLNKYENRILGISLTAEELTARGLAGVAGFSDFRNFGGITSYGAELNGDWQTPIEGLKLVASIAYQISEFEDDLIVGYRSFHGNPAHARGKYYEPIPLPGGGTPSSPAPKSRAIAKATPPNTPSTSTPATRAVRGSSPSAGNTSTKSTSTPPIPSSSPPTPS